MARQPTETEGKVLISTGSELPDDERGLASILARLQHVKTNARVEIFISVEGGKPEAEIDDTLARLGVGIDRENEKMDGILSRLRRTPVIA